MSSGNLLLKLVSVVAASIVIANVSAESFSTDVDVTSGNVEIQENGRQLQLTLNQSGGAVVQAKQKYLYGRFDMQIKVVSGYSAGTVSSFFLQSPRPAKDEMDFELLGNVTGEPYILQTNVWTNGQGDREQQMYLWFDPRADFHNYTFIWNPHIIMWLVDGVPVRVYKNAQHDGIPYLSSQALNACAALGNGDGWATREGKVKIDWGKAPFVAYYRGYHSENKGPWWDWIFDDARLAKLKAVREKYLVYDYCQDTGRFPQGFPRECGIN